MTGEPDTSLVLPASIPFEELKGRDLEECVYWLLEAMGARDLEWRSGGSGGRAADQGRDLEATFYASSADGEMKSQRWWIECRGRQGTVEPEAVKSAVANSLAADKLDYLVIATNTTFSNPTRDWVTQWQRRHPLPKVRLWDRTQLDLRIGVAKAEKIEIARRTKWVVEPRCYQHCAFQHEAVSMRGLAEAIEKPFKHVAREKKIVGLLAFPGNIQQSVSHGCAHVAFGFTHSPS
jgi:hypothetical protein